MNRTSEKIESVKEAVMNLSPRFANQSVTRSVSREVETIMLAASKEIMTGCEIIFRSTNMALFDIVEDDQIMKVCEEAVSSAYEMYYHLYMDRIKDLLVEKIANGCIETFRKFSRDIGSKMNEFFFLVEEEVKRMVDVFECVEKGLTNEK